MIALESIVTIAGFVLFALNLILAATIIFVEKRDIGTTWAWLFVLMFLPLIGFLIYLFFGRSMQSDNFYRVLDEERAAHSARIAIQQDLVARKAGVFGTHPLLKKYSQLLKMNLTSTNALVSFENAASVIHDGEQKFQRLMQDISDAKKEINVQYYILQNDALGTALVDKLTEKANEGIKVRLLYDAVGSRGLARYDFSRFTASGGEVKSFFPSTLGINFRVNNRNHRKLCIIDGAIGYVGGFNVGTEYLGTDPKFGYWRDVHLRFEGEVIDQLLERFLLDWNRSVPTKVIESRSAFEWHSPGTRSLTPVQIVTSGPNSSTEHSKNMLIKMISAAKSSIYIQSPYFIPDASFLDACRIALLSGVEINLMIPNKPDHIFVYWATFANAAELVRYGANVYTYESGFLHAKTLVVDEEVASIGTVNIDARSFRLNFEISALVYDAEVARSVTEAFRKDLADCELLTLERYESRPHWIRFKESIARLLSPIL